jgi:hypothetical protein
MNAYGDIHGFGADPIVTVAPVMATAITAACAVGQPGGR